MTTNRKLWDRKLWAVEFISKREKPMLIGGSWHPANAGPRYPGEPSRCLLFTTRASAHAWCAEKMAEFAGRTDSLKYWRFRPVRVREIIAPLRK